MAVWCRAAYKAVVPTGGERCGTPVVKTYLTLVPVRHCMSRTAADGDDAELDGEVEEPEIEEDPEMEEDPEIEEDLFEEELRIDGICGVY
jgi:mycofactocin precursor